MSSSVATAAQHLVTALPCLVTALWLCLWSVELQVSSQGQAQLLQLRMALGMLEPRGHVATLSWSQPSHCLGPGHCHTQSRRRQERCFTLSSYRPWAAQTQGPFCSSEPGSV